MQTTQTSRTYPFSIESMPFNYDALEPYIDALTMEIHHKKHHQAYVDKLNAALKPYPDLHDFTVEELLQQCDALPSAIRKTVYEQGGGHFHHEYFWKILKPDAERVLPSDSLVQAIERDFGSFESFKKRFTDIGAKHFNSGWVFLTADKNGKLEVFSRPAHDNILNQHRIMLIINDLWEHAYYLKYKNKREKYLNEFWSIVNWDYVSQRFENINSSKEIFE